MIRSAIRPLLAAALLALPAAAPAQDVGPFSDGSAAKSWNLAYEESARFEATVVDLLCELSGDCPADCGDGRRQLGLKRAADGALVLPVKNNQFVFSGAADDLLPYCGKAVEVDGLIVRNEDIENAPPVFQLQMIRAQGGDWAKAKRFTRVWAERNPEAAQEKGPWFRKDPRVKAQIAAHGYLGLGAETDAAFMEYYFE